MTRAYRWLSSLTGLYANADRNVERVRQACRRAAQGFLASALTREERSLLTIELYGISNRHSTSVRALSAWEQTWFEAELPEAPARVLLGAAGRGREAAWLVSRGYTVDAFEPAAGCEAALRGALADGGRVAIGSYRELIDAAQNRAYPHTRLHAFAGTRYDAVILGWGSLTHVLGSEAQCALLRTCHELCPTGPILASFWYSAELADDAEHDARATRWGRQLGTLVARTRPTQPEPAREERFVSHAGFGVTFTTAHVESLAKHVGRTVRLSRATYPHATFVASVAQLERGEAVVPS
jgi:hypothetical protein